MSLAIILGVCAFIAPGRGDWNVPLVALHAQDAAPTKTNSQQAKTVPQTQSTTPGTAPQTVPPPAKKPPVVKHPVPQKKSTSATRKKKKPVAKKANTPANDDAPPKRVIRNGSTPEPSVQISPSMPQGQADTQQQKTNSLLSTTEENLKSISGNQLTDSQEEMVKQIRMYVEQAKTEQSAGDVERANNLATKAQLLSAELVKH